jgi:beta-lactamase superfamily II metal-dependent hydrolase
MRHSLFFIGLVSLAACSLPSPNRLEKEPSLSGSTEISQEISEDLKIFVPSIGQGDATLIQTPSGKFILIDTGPPHAGVHLSPLLKKLGVGRLDAVLISHYDLDHLGGISDLIAGPDQISNTKDDVEVSVSLDRGGTPWDESPGYNQYLNILFEKNILRQTLNAGETIDFDPAIKIRCLAANGKVWSKDGAISEVDLTPETYAGQENAASIALLVEFGDFRYLTAGDLTGGGSLNGFLTPDIESLLSQAVGSVTALHANHHGSLTSSNPAFVSTTSPETVFIQAGADNSYGHPHEAVVRRWEQSGAQVFSTVNGWGFVLTTDGETHEIRVLD